MSYRKISMFIKEIFVIRHLSRLSGLIFFFLYSWRKFKGDLSFFVNEEKGVKGTFFLGDKTLDQFCPAAGEKLADMFGLDGSGQDNLTDLQSLALIAVQRRS